MTKMTTSSSGGCLSGMSSFVVVVLTVVALQQILDIGKRQSAVEDRQSRIEETQKLIEEKLRERRSKTDAGDQVDDRID